MMLISNRYQLLDKLGSGGMGIVYHAQDRLTGQTIALKRVLLKDSGLSSDDRHRQRLTFAREFRTLAGLRHPNIVSVLDYGFFEGDPYITMEFLPNAQPLDHAAQGLPLAAKVGLLVEMLQALSYLHRRGVLHRDLKPGNVLVTADGTVKVLDFGLARNTMRTSGNTTFHGVAGTLSYLAPELFSDQLPSIASDLYAVGVICCEVLLGRHPFPETSIAKLIMALLTREPDLDGLPDALDQVIRRLLVKDPAERYPDAWSASDALCTAANLEVPPESREQREGFLQAAPFIGRRKEVHQLRDAMQEVKSGIGSAWLVGGESGIGKSRLVDELRINALIEGLTVLSGYALPDSGAPYQLWHEPLRFLCINSMLDDTEANLLRKLIPDIEQLLRRSVPSIPLPDGLAYQLALVETIKRLLKNLRSPVLVILEDLQWCSESLEVLQAITAANLQVMIVGTYRYEERPSLPSELPGMQILRLERLKREDIADLTFMMLGEQAKDPALIDFLMRETEGNVLFLIETVRALTENVQHLNSFTFDLQNIRVENVETLIRRRISGLPALHLIKIAAVSGRWLDMKLLQTFDSPENLKKWLRLCENMGLLEVHDNQWRFSHNKLREIIVADLSPAERVNLNRQVAAAIEWLYPNDKSLTAVLMDHWWNAQDGKKASHYAYLAAEESVNTGAYRQGIDFCKRGLEMNPEPQTKASILYCLAELWRYDGQMTSAIDYYIQSIAVAREHPESAVYLSALRQLAYVYTL